jgi:ketosteroid isomerase-like protein
MTDLSDIERRLRHLEDERDIARLIASYGPLVDAGDADRASALWTEDGSYDVGDWLMASRAEVAAMVRSDAHQGLIARGCCHFFGPPVVTVDGDDAVAVCESALMVRRDAGGYGIARAGVHLVHLRREAGGWRIVSRVARGFDGGEASRELIAEGLGGN